MDVLPLHLRCRKISQDFILWQKHTVRDLLIFLCQGNGSRMLVLGIQGMAQYVTTQVLLF